MRSLIGLSQIAAMRGDPEQAAALLATVDLVAAESEPFFPPYVRAVATSCERAVRARLGDAQFAAAQQTVRSQLPMTAIAAAGQAAEVLASTQPPAPRQLETAGVLTAHELDVLRLIAEGRSNQQIADALFISHKTVRNRVSIILSKLGVDSRTAAASLALRNHLV